MKPLAHKHSAQLLLGAVIVGEELATKNRQTTFASLCQDAVHWAVEVRDLLREIANDAAYAAERFDLAMSDGALDIDEHAEIRGYFEEIEREALTGKIE